MTNEQIRKIAEGIGSMVREWMTGPNPLAGDGLESVIEKRLHRELPGKRPKLETVAQLGGAPDDLRNLILVALRNKSLTEIQAITAEVISRRDPSLAPAARDDEEVKAELLKIHERLLTFKGQKEVGLFASDLFGWSDTILAAAIAIDLRSNAADQARQRDD